MSKTITIDGIEYVPKNKATGNRAVVVVDRGWVFAGDVTDKDGRIRIDNALHVFKWDSIGFDGMIADPKSEKVTLKKLTSCVELPAGAEVFRVPVDDKWGR